MRVGVDSSLWCRLRRNCKSHFARNRLLRFGATSTASDELLAQNTQSPMRHILHREVTKCVRTVIVYFQRFFFAALCRL